MIAMKLSSNEEQLIKDYARLQNQSVSEVIRSAILEKIENEYDVRAADEAYNEYLNDPVDYSVDEVRARLKI